MNNKKRQFYLINVVGFISLIAWYYKDTSSNHFYHISYPEGTGNYFSYLYFSTFIFIYHYLGAWFTTSTIVYSLSYALLYSRRMYFKDNFQFLPISFMCIGWFSLFLPDLLGPQLQNLINEYSNDYVQTLLAVSSTYFFIRGLQKLKDQNEQEHQIIMPQESIPIQQESVIQVLTFEIQKEIQKEIQEERIEENEESKELAELPQDFTAVEEEDMDLLIENQEETPIPIPIPAHVPTPPKIKPTKINTTIAENDLISLLPGHPDMREKINSEVTEFAHIVHCLESKLSEFKIAGKIINVLKGPVVNTFELELGAGVKVSKITSVIEDLGLALGGQMLRCVYPMKGKTTIGIEVPMEKRETIYLKDLLLSENYAKTQKTLPLVMGKNTFDEVIITDLAEMPHMMVAGSTGAGKSVFLNTILVSLLIKKHPNDLKLILIDPKQLELAIYAQVPHLILPVITDSPKAQKALEWACVEMDRRFSVLKETNARNIQNFNSKAHPDQKLPFIVIIIDEFADLILAGQHGKFIENNICRLAAKARACGIHLIMATQRPSVDVITGLIKANFPTRVSFRVTSSMDSRTILNVLGAEKLLGKGDMLYKQGIEMHRLHSGFINEDDLVPLLETMSTIRGEYLNDAMEFLEAAENEKESSDDNMQSTLYDSVDTNDQIYHDVLALLYEQKAISASMIQRRLRIGHNRASTLIDLLDKKGLIGPYIAGKPRELLSQSSTL